MIDLAIGVRTDGVPEDEDIRRWEGWILGQSQGVGCTYLPDGEHRDKAEPPTWSAAVRSTIRTCRRPRRKAA